MIDTDGQLVSPGQQVPSPVMEAALALHELVPDLSAMYYGRATGISFKTPEGWLVRVGDSHAMKAKLMVAAALRNQLLEQGASPQGIDVRYPDTPFYY